MKAHFDYPKGYSIVKDTVRSTWWKAIYEFTLDAKFPMTYVATDGTRIRPDIHFFTDQGTVPRLGLQFFVPKDRFLGFYFHDSCCIHGGLWVWKPIPIVNKDGTISFSPFRDSYVFVKFTRAEADTLLHDMVLADPKPGWGITADAVWVGVRIGSLWTGSSYGKGDGRFRNNK